MDALAGLCIRRYGLKRNGGQGGRKEGQGGRKGRAAIGAFALIVSIAAVVPSVSTESRFDVKQRLLQ